MFVSDRLVFLQLQKTGSTHVASLLSEVIDGKQYKKHSRLPSHLMERFAFCSIRNPWDWYVSLWAYGCQKQGTFYRRLTSLGHFGIRTWLGLPVRRPIELLRSIVYEFFKPVATWQNLYANKTDVEMFRCWLKMILDPQRRYDLGEGYGASSVWHHVGFYTYRYLRICSGDSHWLFQQTKLSDLKEIVTFDTKFSVLDAIIRTENLESDLERVLQQAGYTIQPQQRASIKNTHPKNVSQHMSPRKYYDDETRQMVANAEKLICEKYGYNNPSF